MKMLIFALGLTSYLMWAACSDDAQNVTQPGKDTYTILATAFHFGFLTNKTDNVTDLNSTGNQESVTLYHSNGTSLDLSAVPEPFLTNITAQNNVDAPALSKNETQEIQRLAYILAAFRQLTYPEALRLGRTDAPTSEEGSSNKVDEETTPGQ